MEEAAFDPKQEHEHKWVMKWEDTVRECSVCNLRQWRLACWTNNDYKKAPAQIYDARPDLKKRTEGVHIWTDKPHLIRSLDIVPLEILKEPITLVGAGSIGSFTALALYKMGFERIVVYDPDVVKPENLGTQLCGDYAMRLGWSKSYTLGQLLRSQTVLGRSINEPPCINPYNVRFENQVPSGLVISAVDSMAARRTIWENVKKHRKTDWFIDGRMGAEFALLYTMNPMNPKDVAAYEKTLYTDENSVQEPCTAKATVYTAFLIAGLIAKAVKDVLTYTPYPRIVHWNIKDHSQQIWKGQHG